MHRNKTEQTLKIVHQNIHGYSGKEDEIQEFLKKQDVDVLCLTEHWQTDVDHNWQFEGYGVVSNFCRKNKIRGGSAIVVKADLLKQSVDTNSTEIRNMSKEGIIELSCLELRNQIYICTYTPNVGVYNEFEPIMKRALDVATATGKTVTVCGDFNVDLLRDSGKRTKILKMFSDAGLQPLFEEPTRVTRSTATCIDNVFSNSDYKDKRIINTLRSDHSGQMVTFNVAEDETNSDINGNDFNLRPVIETCEECDRRFTSRAGYLSHMRAHQRQNTGKPTRYSCDICGHGCGSGAGLASHMRTHEGQKTKSAEEDKMNNYKDGTPQEKSVPIENKGNPFRYNCGTCGRTCGSGAGLASHMRAHEHENTETVDYKTKNNKDGKPKEKPLPTENKNSSSGYGCSTCGQACATGAGLASHMRAHERQKTESAVDDKTNNYKDGKPKEKSIPTENKNSPSGYHCGTCGLVCASGAGLVNHMRAHEYPMTSDDHKTNIQKNETAKEKSLSTENKDKPSGYSCDTCGQTCGSGAGLASHMRAHERKNTESDQTLIKILTPSIKTSISSPTSTNSSGYSCNVCGQICGSGAGLASHMRAHEGKKTEYAKPLSEYNNSSNTTSYYREEAPSTRSSYGTGYSCDQCSQVCASGAGLASHKRAHERRSEYTQPQLSYNYSSYSSNSRASYSPQSNYSSGYSCGLCGQTCGSGAGLASHMRAHARR